MDELSARRLLDPVGRGPRMRRRYARVGGAMCIAGAVLSVPCGLLLEPGEWPAVVLLAGLAAALGAACFAIRWERVPVVALEAAPALVTAIIAIEASAIDPGYGFYLVLVAGFAAYSFTDARVVAAHVGLIFIALAAAVAFGAGGTREALAAALTYGSGVVLMAGLAVYLRRRIDAREAAYRQFAADALELAGQIRSRVGSDQPPAGGGAAMISTRWAPGPMANARRAPHS